LGLQDTTILIKKIPVIEPDSDIKEIFIFTGEGILILNSLLYQNTNNACYVENYDAFSLYVKKLAKTLFSQTHNPKNQNLNFHKFQFKNLKLFFLTKGGLIYAGVFSENTRSHFIKLFLTHMYVAFINFNGELVDILRKTSTHLEGVIFNSY
jgi:hypothetical protein